MFKKKCKNCGYKNDLTDKFCYQCGKPLNKKYKDDDFIEEENNYKVDQPGDVGCLMFFTYFVPFLGIVIGLSFLFSKNKTKRDDGFMVLSIGIVVVLVELIISLLIFK